MHPLQDMAPPPLKWRSLPQAARERGLRPDLLRIELEARQARVARLGRRGLFYVVADDLVRFDAALQAEAEAAALGVPA